MLVGITLISKYMLVNIFILKFIRLIAIERMGGALRVVGIANVVVALYGADESVQVTIGPIKINKFYTSNE